MRNPPSHIGKANVIRWSFVDSRHTATDACRHVIAGEPQATALGPAICRYEGESACYLFYCDRDWNVVTDTWHPSIEGAMRQAEREYADVSET